MTADERIERLLNRFGQTIYDLPKPQTADYAYEKCHIGKAYKTATEWHGRLNSGSLDTGDYICHLADVIDRMETALETAALAIDCGLCEYWYEDHECGRKCKEIAKIADCQLSGMTEREFDDFVVGEEHTDA